MAKKEWGSKHICPDCEAKFYDLFRDPIECPKCGRQVVVEAVEAVKLNGDGDEEPVLADDDSAVIDEADGTNVAIDDNVLDDGDDDAIPLDDITDMPDEDED